MSLLPSVSVSVAACSVMICCFTSSVADAVHEIHAWMCFVADALHEKLEDMAWVDEQPWEESLVLTSAAPTQVDDVDDDLGRELAFYNQVKGRGGLGGGGVQPHLAHEWLS